MARNVLVGLLVGLLASAGGCAGPGLVVRSERGEAARLDLSKVCPVEYAKTDLQEAVSLFAEHLARVVKEREGQLHVHLASADARVEAYLGWCSRRGTPGDCLGLLDARTPDLSVGAMHTIAVREALAYGLQEAAEVVRTIDPVKVEALMVIWFTIYLASLVFPDVTVTKALNVLMTANLIAFLGWDGFRNIIQGYRDMSKEVDRARTFQEVQVAGERYGRRMGASMVRIVTALATWGLSASTGVVRPVTQLPGGAQAVANAQAQGIRLAAVTGGSVSVSASGTVTLVVAAEALSGPESASRPLAEQPTQTSQSTLVAKVKSQLWRYPRVIDPRTGRPIPFPAGQLKRVPVQQRVAWGNAERGAFIREWHERGYATPRGGWDNYDIHHIHPRELGGGNSFWNLVPVERATHQTQLNTFWMEFMR